MDLILWRHAEARDGSPDHDRKLTPKGRKQAEAVGAWLAGRLPADARVLSSPAVRTRQTADGLGRPYELVEEIAPGADETAVLNVAGWPESAGTVLVVGHQPTLGRVAAWLLCGEPRDFTLKKGGLVWLSSRSRRDETRILLRAAVSPELL